MRPTTRPSRRARKYSASPWLKNAFRRRFRNSRRSSFSGGTHCGWLACRRNGRSMNRFRSRAPETDLTSTPTAEAPYMHTSTDVFAKVRDHERAELLARRARGGRPALLPRAHLAGDAGRRDGGRRADHARLEQLPRPDRRRARDAGRRGRAAPLRHRPDRLAPAQRHDPAAPRARARDRRVDGHRGRDRLHDRPPGQRRHARHAARRPATR